MIISPTILSKLHQDLQLVPLSCYCDEFGEHHAQLPWLDNQFELFSVVSGECRIMLEPTKTLAEFIIVCSKIQSVCAHDLFAALLAIHHDDA